MANNSQFTGMQPPQPHPIGHMGPPPSALPPMPMQFRPGAPPPPPQTFVPMAPQQFQPVGHSNMGMQFQPVAAPPPPQPQLQRPSLVGPPLPPPDFQPIRPLMSAPAQPQLSNNFVPSFGGSTTVPYTLSSGSIGQQSDVGSTIHQSMSQTNIPNFSAGGQSWFPTGNQNMQAVMPPQQSMEQTVGVQPWFSTGNPNINSVTPLQQTGEPNAGVQQWIPNWNQNVQSDMTEERSAVTVNSDKTTKPDPVGKASTEWREHTSHNGKKYYYNKRTRTSSWEKPLELMTTNERADATTDWRECTSPEGRKFYYNKAMKISKWRIPDEVKLARERANTNSSEGTSTMKVVNTHASADVSAVKALTPKTNNSPFPVQQMVSSPVPIVSGANPEPTESFGPSSIQEEVAYVKSEATDSHSPLESSTPVDIITTSPVATPMRTYDIAVTDEAAPSSMSAAHSAGQEANEITGISDSGCANLLEGKNLEHGPLVYESKEEAKNAFKALLEMADVGSSWNWDQAMKAIINDRRYAALKTLGERKQVFSEFVAQKKKQEAEEKRAKQKKAREDFKNMLEESEDLTSSTRWSKAVSMFENDERFQAIERAKDREDLFVDYIEEVKKKERAKALEEHKRYTIEYLDFLKSCDFITASSQWRKVQHRLEADERCSRLEKIERLEIFQEYVRDLEKEEEEERKLRKEELRKAERKNRDEFRKLMEEHVANGIITPHTLWRDYCMKVKDAPAYLAVSSNTSGSTAKDLFDDVIEDLEKQFADDKERIEDTVKTEKISVSTCWTIEDFKGALSKEISSKPISDINLKLVFDELLEKAKEKEEKEAKKHKRLADDVYEFLYSSKDVSTSSKWEDCKPLVEERFIGEDSFFRDIFDKLIAELKEKEKEKEKKRKEAKAKKEKERNDREKKEKERKSRDRGGQSRKGKERRKREETDTDGSDSYGVEESRRSRDRTRKHRKRRRDSLDDVSLDNEENDRSKSHRYIVDSKKSKQVEKRSLTSEADSGSQRKRHKGDSRDRSSKDYDKEETNDEELGEDGELLR